MGIYVKSVEVKNIVKGRSHIREDVLNVDTMKALHQEKCLINVNFHYELHFI